MLQRTFAFGGALLIAAALVFLTPGQAASHGGFRVGGFQVAGLHAGGFRVGGLHVGGVRSAGFYYGGYRPLIGGYYGGYGLYPSYGVYNPSYVYNYNFYPPPYFSGYATVPPGAGYGAPGTAEQLPAPAAEVRARLTVVVPADAEVWCNGTQKASTGSIREFTSPPLKPGSRYEYDIQVKWKENGQEVSQGQEVHVTAGSHVSVSFLASPRTTGQAPPPKQK